MDGTWTFTVPMPILVGVPLCVVGFIAGMVGRTQWRKHTTRLANEREERVAEKRRDSELQASIWCQQKEEKKQEAEKRAKDKLPQAWYELLIELKGMPKYFQWAWFQECLKDELLPQLSIDGAQHFAEMFCETYETRKAAVEALAPYFDIGWRKAVKAVKVVPLKQSRRYA